jgi:hypothetical protein
LVRGRREDKHAALRKLVARLRPTHELVIGPRRRKRGAPAQAVTPDIDKLRKHAASWMRAHGKAHRELAELPKPAPRLRGAPKTPGSTIIRVRHRASVLAHPPHQSKHVLISLATGKIVGHQG